MHEEPLHLIPEEFRADVESQLNVDGGADRHKVRIRGELCPYCRWEFNERLKKCDGDWVQVIDQVRVKRILLSEKNRVGDRHVSAQGRKESGFHRTYRRHQLPENRRVRYGQ